MSGACRGCGDRFAPGGWFTPYWMPRPLLACRKCLSRSAQFHEAHGYPPLPQGDDPLTYFRSVGYLNADEDLDTLWADINAWRIGIKVKRRWGAVFP